MRSGRGTMYDPHEHAHRLGLRVEHHPLSSSLLGRYFHSRRLIVLRPGMTRVQERCTLAHEVVHAEHGDLDTQDPLRWARQERRADWVAAERLIDPAALNDAGRFRSDLVWLAAELDVTPWLLRAWLQNSALAS